MYRDFTDIGDICDSRDVTNYSEPSDEHQMGAHQKSLQKPSQHTLATSQTEAQRRGRPPHPPTIAANIGQIAIFADTADTPETIRSGGRTLIWKVAPGGAINRTVIILSRTSVVRQHPGTSGVSSAPLLSAAHP